MASKTELADYLQRESTPEVPVADALDAPWTHRYTIYVNGPSASFLEELKSKDGVVAVFEKVKEVSNPPNS